jgi:hypothetical protein
MTYTYDLNEHGCLIIKANVKERREMKRHVKAIAKEREWSLDGAKCQYEYDVLDSLTHNTELDVIRREEIGALTSAIRMNQENGR